MEYSWLLWLPLLIPVAGAGVCRLLPSSRAVLGAVLAGVGLSALAGLAAVVRVWSHGPLFAAGSWLYLDALSAWHLALLLLVFTLSSWYSLGYFSAAGGHGLDRDQARRFAPLWFGALAAMTLVLLSNNLGIMWVGIEATTLLTAFLICLHPTPASVEAMWKYLIICSVGVAFAFIGTLLAGAAAQPLGLPPSETLLWTRLRAGAAGLNPALMKMSFLFLLVGYGTKAGLAPMHTWLPDAHSQAPAPVSAIFSGFMLNTALYCLMRYLPLVEKATGCSRWGLRLLMFFGLFSILLASAFILFQHDAKRLLAYHSVEHIGIISVGLALGGWGTWAALFHTANHSLCKSLGFFSAGRLGQLYGTHDLRRLAGSLGRFPVWGGGFFLSLLALIGVAPFAIFLSEFQILKAAVESGNIVAVVVFLAGTGLVFIGALQHAMGAAWGRAEPAPAAEPARRGEAFLVFLPLAVLLCLGLWMPEWMQNALSQAANILDITK